MGMRFSDAVASATPDPRIHKSLVCHASFNSRQHICSGVYSSNVMSLAAAAEFDCHAAYDISKHL